MGMHGLDWSGWGQGQVTSTCECSNEPSFSIKCEEFLTSWGPISFSGKTLLVKSVSYVLNAVTAWRNRWFSLLFSTSTFIMRVYDTLRCYLFCRYVREGSDRTRGDDITKFLSVELDTTEARIRKLLQRHPYWCSVPLMTVRDTMDFLLNRGFTRDQILFSIHAVLYSRFVIQGCCYTICSRPF